MSYNKNGTLYLSLSFYWIGWKWGYAVMRIQDQNGEFKNRLSLCKKLDDFPDTEMFDWEDLNVDNMEYITQSGGHINFKTKENAEACFTRILEEFNDPTELQNRRG